MSSWERSPHTGHQIRSEGHTLIPTSIWECCALKKKKKEELSHLTKTAFGKQFALLILFVCMLRGGSCAHKPSPTKKELQEYFAEVLEIPKRASFISDDSRK